MKIFKKLTSFLLFFTATIFISCNGLNSSKSGNPDYIIPLNDAVQSLACDSLNNIYAGGRFTSAGDLTLTHIGKWNGSSWSEIGSGIKGFVLSIVLDSSGNIYAGGMFDTAGGVSANYIAKWDGISWAHLGAGLSGKYSSSYCVYCIAVDSSDNIYAGGNFTIAGSISANYIAKWNGSSWSALGSGMNGVVNTIAFDSSGNLYAGGFFTKAGGVTVNHIAKWNGYSWYSLGTGMDNVVDALVFDSLDNLYIGGFFTTRDGYESKYLAEWPKQ